MTIPYEPGILHVHVDNTEDIKKAAVRTEEKEAEHYTCSSFTLPQGEIIGTGVTAVEPTQILQLDTQRKRAVISFNGQGQIILAHSIQQATSLAQNVQQAADQGALLTCPTTITVEATGPLWAVGLALSSADSPVSVSTAASVTNPATFTTVSNFTPPAGFYQFVVQTYLSGTVTAADEDNMRFVIGGVSVAPKLLVPANGSLTTYTYNAYVNGAQVVQVQTTNGTSGVSAIYHAALVATPLDTSSNLVIGVTQERRGNA